VIVLLDDIKYHLITPDSEATLEKAIQSNHRHIFGEDSFYFDVKRLIRSKAGIASIPDGYVLLFDPKPKWCIVEVELASHPIDRHIIPQLSRFNRGIENSQTRRILVETLYAIFDKDEDLRARLKQKIGSGEVHKFISDLISLPPLTIVAIDQKTEELEEALRDVRGDKKVVEFRTFRREGSADDVNAYVYEPVFKTSKSPENTGPLPIKPRDNDDFERFIMSQNMPPERREEFRKSMDVIKNIIKDENWKLHPKLNAKSISFPVAGHPETAFHISVQKKNHQLRIHLGADFDPDSLDLEHNIKQKLAQRREKKYQHQWSIPMETQEIQDCLPLLRVAYERLISKYKN